MDILSVRRIEEPEPAEMAAVAELEAEVFGRGGLNEWHLPVIARRGRLFVIKEGDAVVGAASVIRCWNPAHAFLVDLAVNPDRRRRGIARSLLKSVIAELRQEGIARLELTAAPDNTAAAGLYRELGFEAVAELPNEYGPGRDRRLLALALTHD